MKIFFNRIQREPFPYIIYALFFTLLFGLIGFLFPYSYYRFFDTRDYIQVAAPITWDKKIYNKCDTLRAFGKRTVDVDTDLEVQVRLVRIEPNMKLNYIWEKKYPSQFLVKTDKAGRLLIADFPLPCKEVDIKPGVYFLDGFYTYWVHDVRRFYSFYTAQFTIVEGAASETPGPQGIQGIQGIQGTQGAQGIQGSQGAQGNSSN